MSSSIAASSLTNCFCSTMLRTASRMASERLAYHPSLIKASSSATSFDVNLAGIVCNCITMVYYGSLAYIFFGGRGAQNGSQSMLDRISRGHTVEDVKYAVELCRDYDLTPVVDVIFGLPYETVTDQQETLDLVGFVVNKGGRIHSHYFTPLPGTPLEYAVPSPVGKDVNRVMGRLALAGKVTGVWEPDVRR